MKKVVMRIAGRGCPGCIASALVHVFRIEGVRGAKVIGNELVVLIDDSTDPSAVVEDKKLNDYYKVLSWKVEEAPRRDGRGEYRLALA